MWSTCCLCHTVQLAGVKYGSCFASSLGSLAGEPGNEATSSLVSRPLPNLPPFQERPGTHCLRMHKIFRYIFHKKLLCTFLSICWRLYRVFFELDSNDLNLHSPTGIPATFQMWQYHFSKRTVQQKQTPDPMQPCTKQDSWNQMWYHLHLRATLFHKAAHGMSKLKTSSFDKNTVWYTTTTPDQLVTL